MLVNFSLHGCFEVSILRMAACEIRVCDSYIRIHHLKVRSGTLTSLTSQIALHGVDHGC